jgi:dTDP-4-dehydrorhamnose reductase
VDDVADAILNLANQKMAHCGLSGVFHWGGPNSMTKYEMAQSLGKKFNLDTSHITPETDLNDPNRPHDATMDVHTLKLMGISKQTEFEDGVDCLQEWLPK